MCEGIEHLNTLDVGSIPTVGTYLPKHLGDAGKLERLNSTEHPKYTDA